MLVKEALEYWRAITLCAELFILNYGILQATQEVSAQTTPLFLSSNENAYGLWTRSKHTAIIMNTKLHLHTEQAMEQTVVL